MKVKIKKIKKIKNEEQKRGELSNFFCLWKNWSGEEKLKKKNRVGMLFGVIFYVSKVSKVVSNQ